MGQWAPQGPGAPRGRMAAQWGPSSRADLDSPPSLGQSPVGGEKHNATMIWADVAQHAKWGRPKFVRGFVRGFVLGKKCPGNMPGSARDNN